MNILTVENEIISALQTAIPDLKVEGFPDNPAQYTLLHSRGAVLVRFQGAAYIAPRETAFVQQEATLTFNLALKVRGLRDKHGAFCGTYGYIDGINSALTGYAPVGCGKMYPVSTAFSRENAGVWEYALNFAVPIENLG